MVTQVQEAPWYLSEAWIGGAGRLVPRTLLNATICLWGYVKDQVYQPPMSQFFRENISLATANVDEPQRTLEECEDGVHVCRVTNGALMEDLYKIFFSFITAFGLFDVCICTNFEITVISYHQNHF
jgi:hypothetical protein